MKMFNKSDCEYKGGYIVCNGEVVAVNNEIVDLFNKLEEDVQRAKFEHKKKIVAPFAEHYSNEEFSRETEHGKIFPHVIASTPTLDKMADRTVKMMDEIDGLAKADRTNDYFEGIVPLIMFVNDEFVVSGEQGTQHRFDLPTIGDPLAIDKDALSEFVTDMFDILV